MSLPKDTPKTDFDIDGTCEATRTYWLFGILFNQVHPTQIWFVYILRRNQGLSEILDLMISTRNGDDTLICMLIVPSTTNDQLVIITLQVYSFQSTIGRYLWLDKTACEGTLGKLTDDIM